MTKFGALWVAVWLMVALTAACGASGGSTQEHAGSTTATAATITIASMSYGEPVTVPSGAQVAVANNDPQEHSVTSDAAGAFTVDVDGNGHGTFTAPSAPGEYPFHCTYHPSMHGMLIVS
ncbi:cupredoxin domain-containing protein [Mycolicibacterium rufum]|uniref:Cupredoxin domain-containing protein n=1 Tax=Mycolicibacterium rufum TaxID=318424 RepID=A0A9X2YET3_9MYCO|nr:cupredoxin domain-containing protein [Mycolicibacterium rufum]KGI67405.1 plastocyanin [Mycolicibacterium rufum]MCV7072764.1 cupredoxin domain-containing protein [Mycolicibacterium rufum]ULP38343.1 cupredoxin domain-containing protein [Mycolicibacterium rufum]